MTGSHNVRVDALSWLVAKGSQGTGGKQNRRDEGKVVHVDGMMNDRSTDLCFIGTYYLSVTSQCLKSLLKSRNWLVVHFDF